MITVRVQTEDFHTGDELQRLRLHRSQVGALVSFVGQVRDINQEAHITSLTLEHYPGMTEKSLTRIAEQAHERWSILDSLIVHRVGTLQACDQIVLVAVTSAHRGDAFRACEFIMDYLKTEAPFWKKEHTPQGDRWVEARHSDEQAREKW